MWAVIAILAVAVTGGVAHAGEPVLYDTVVPLGSLLTAEILRGKSGWKPVQAATPLSGDAVFENSRLVVDVRPGDGRLMIYYKWGGNIRLSAAVTGVGDEAAAGSFSAIMPADRGDGVAVTARRETEAGQTRSLRCRLQGDRPIVTCSAEAGTTRLSVSFPGGSGHALAPDVFGDDVILRAAETTKAVQHLAGEFAVVHPLDGGDAILMLSWPPAPKDISVQLGTAGTPPRFVRSDIPCVESEPVSISVLAGNGIWFETDSSRFNTGEYRKLDWKPPFPAQYRCDLRRADAWKLTDSWRRVTTTNRTWFSFLNYCFPPLCINDQGALLRIPKFSMSGALAINQPREIAFAGPVLIYPFAADIPKQKGPPPAVEWTVLDVLQATQGEGWVQALDVGEGVLRNTPYPKGFVYVATCAATENVEKIFDNREEKAQAPAIKEWLDSMNKFVLYNRTRLDEYVAFAKTYNDYVDEHRKTHPAHPGLEQALAELEPLAQYLPDEFRKNRETIKSPEHCRDLTAKIVALIDGADPDKIGKVRKLGKELRTIGGTQDDMLAAFRMSLKILRQRAGQIHAGSEDPLVRDVMRNLRRLTQTILRIRSPYEGH